jgi:hypothetical protein
MMLILTIIDGLFFVVLLITLVCMFVFIDDAEMGSHGWLVIYPMGLSIIYFSVSFIKDIKKVSDT